MRHEHPQILASLGGSWNQSLTMDTKGQLSIALGESEKKSESDCRLVVSNSLGPHGM